VTFGIIFNAGAGMVPLIFTIGLFAMLFTALSYVQMSRVYPVAGSVYAYAGRAIGQGAGFIAGWVMLLDYLLLPALCYIGISIAIHAVAPAIPASIWVVVPLVFCTVVNLLGIETTARTSML
jgi:amino acid transporter